jgi:hypothetical protein
MNKLENWQPLFRFLERIDNSDLAGLVFSIVYLICAFAGWYWVCYKKGAELWKARIVSWNKRFGIDFNWIPPFILKVFASILLLSGIFGVFVALLAINR